MLLNHNPIVYYIQSRPLLNRAIENQEFDELVDPRLDGNFDDVEMFRVIEAAAACIRHSAARRPKMGQVHTTDHRQNHNLHCSKSDKLNVHQLCIMHCFFTLHDLFVAHQNLPSSTGFIQIVRVLDSLTDVDLSNGVQPGKSQMFNVANTVDIRQFQRMAFGSQDFSSDYSQSRSSIGSRRDF
jgi:hypothetical protein